VLRSRAICVDTPGHDAPAKHKEEDHGNEENNKEEHILKDNEEGAYR
jgi:hypothetical protein